MGAMKPEHTLRAAQLYYQHHVTMEGIARELRVSRSTVSRLLASARETGLVQISVRSPREMGSKLEKRIAEQYGIRVHVVPIPPGASSSERLERTARAAAHRLASAVIDHSKIGVAWGTTMSAVARHLPVKTVHGTSVVQMNGAANVQSMGVSYTAKLLGDFHRAFSSAVYEFPVPAIFDDPATRDALWRESSVRGVLGLQASVDIFAFGLGSRLGEPRSHVYSGNYFNQRDLGELRAADVVGDCATVFYRADGSTDELPLNARTSGPSFETVRRIPHRLCVVTGAAKQQSLRGALQSGIITELVVDEELARLVSE
ncbi:transcriptional regulator [Leucobacter sp. 7(1)]|nr:transcriptional regulator [Leucobacter sp. 7(1)]